MNPNSDTCSFCYFLSNWLVQLGELEPRFKLYIYKYIYITLQVKLTLLERGVDFVLFIFLHFWGLIL